MTSYCGECGSELGDVGNFCPECGAAQLQGIPQAELASADASVQPIVPPPVSSAISGKFMIAAALGLVGLGGVYFAIREPGSADSSTTSSSPPSVSSNIIPSTNGLSREDAAKLIGASQQIQFLRNNIPTTPGAWQAANQQGILSDWTLSQDAQREIADFRQGQMQIGESANIAVDVTGITGPDEGQIKQVEFAWSYTSMPSLAKRFAVSGGTGKAIFQKYDDGWRLKESSTQNYADAMQLTQSEMAAADADAARQTAKSDAQSARLAQSKTPSTVVRSFSFPEYGRQVPQQVIITDVNVKWLDAIGEWSVYWFGDVKAIREVIWRPTGEKMGYEILTEFSRSRIPAPKGQTEEIYNAVSEAFSDWKSRYPDLVKH